ncbi:MAG: hypothetical protein KJO29_12025, partial [Bacteroidia bacterium]|nr:hypothetical protein [Bacteroidia bacterium]
MTKSTLHFECCNVSTVIPITVCSVVHSTVYQISKQIVSIFIPILFLTMGFSFSELNAQCVAGINPTVTNVSCNGGTDGAIDGVI